VKRRERREAGLYWKLRAEKAARRGRREKRKARPSGMSEESGAAQVKVKVVGMLCSYM
jgi:hypothetical protein